MRKIRDVLRLRHANGLSQRAIARSLGVSKGSIDNYLRRAEVAGLGWPLPDDLSDTALYDKLFPPAAAPAEGGRPEPDWAVIYQELRKPGVTLRLLWEEYRANHPDGYGQSRFYSRYRAWAGRLTPRMRQTHIAGERMFVDFAGQTVPVVDPHTGEIHPAQVFVAVLGASSYTRSAVAGRPAFRPGSCFPGAPAGGAPGDAPRFCGDDHACAWAFRRRPA